MRRILAIMLCASAACATRGIDVTESQGNIDWRAVRAAGKDFAYIMATRGIDCVNSFFNQQYDGAAHENIIRGPVHYAEPNRSTGVEQANYFLSNGGQWRNDGYTLPGAVMFENGPSGDTCWGLGADAMAAWVTDFSTTYKTRTGRLPVIYTSNDWWAKCTANNATFSEHVLWIADYHDMADPLPGGWNYYWLWQSKRDAGNGLGAGDIWNSEYGDLVAFAKGPSPAPLSSSGKSI